MLLDGSQIPAEVGIENLTNKNINLQLLPNGSIEIRPEDSAKVYVDDSETLLQLLVLEKDNPKSVKVTVTPDEGGDEPEPAVVEDLAGLQEAIAENNPDITLSQNITVPSGELQFTGKTHLKGDNKTITFEQSGRNLVFLQPSVIENVVVNTADNESWKSTYAMQVYNGNYTVKNCTFKGGNAGLLVNAANVTLEGTIDVSNNTFGGIEVSKSSNPGTSLPVLNINGATLVNTTEEYGKPTIWIDGEGTVNGAESMFKVVEGGQTKYYLQEENSKKTDTISDINLTEKTQAFCTEYYNKYANKTITKESEEFNNDVVYVNLGEVESSSAKSITINDEEYDNTDKNISIGNNGFIKAPLWKIEGNNLYVSIFTLAVKTVSDEIKVVCGNNTKVITDANSIPATQLPITQVLALNTQEGYKNDITTSDNNTKIVENSEHGTHAVGIVLQSEGEDILDTSIYYLYVSELSMGISTPEEMSGKDVTFAYYGKYSTKPYTEEEQRVFNFTILIPAKGAAEFQLTVNCEVKATEE